jgi:hypothetical protein
MFRTLRDELNDLAWLIRVLVFAAVAGAIYRELRLPPQERTWHGRLLGVIPYDFRLPSLGRIRNAYFNTASDRVFTPEPVGVGWAVNVAAVLKKLGVLSSPARRQPTRGAAAAESRGSTIPADERRPVSQA